MKKVMIIMLASLIAVPAMAESMRTLLTLENKFPEKNQVEIGTLLEFVEYGDADEALNLDDRDEKIATTYVRYGLGDGLAVVAALPYLEIEPDMGDAESGVGDVVLGFEMKAFEDIFNYPYIIPHAEISFDTGDEEKGLGAGENSYEIGISFGTVVEPSWDWIGGMERWGWKNAYHFIADVSYEINDDTENITIASGSVIWEASDQLSFLLEGSISDEELEPDDGHPSYFQAGLAFQATDSFALNVYGGGAKNTDEDVHVSIKASYTF